MSYLLDKKEKRKKFWFYFFAVFLLLIVIYFRSGIFNKFSYLTQIVFHPVLTLGNVFGQKFSGAKTYFESKNALSSENENLQNELNQEQASIANYNSIADDNTQMEAILGRKDPKATMILAAILSKPNQSPYDTLLVDAGAQEGIVTGELVFAFGNLPIGRIASVYPNSSQVILFSNPGEITDVVVSGQNVFMQLIGRGGGDFEMDLVKDVTLASGTQMDLPGINSYLVATVQTTISDPRDNFQKALLVSPVNVQELKFVQVEI